MSYPIKELRKKNEMTQMQLASKMGVDINTISRWERGISKPKVEHQIHLYRILESDTKEWAKRLLAKRDMPRPTNLDEIFMERVAIFFDIAIELVQSVGLKWLGSYSPTSEYYTVIRISDALSTADLNLRSVLSDYSILIEARRTLAKNLPKSIRLKERVKRKKLMKQDVYWALSDKEINERDFLQVIIENVFFGWSTNGCSC